MNSAAKEHRKARARNGPQRLFDVDCKLSYTLLDDTHFLFIIHALDGMDQEVLEESLASRPRWSTSCIATRCSVIAHCG